MQPHQFCPVQQHHCQPINMVYNEVNKGEQHAICSHAALGPLPMKNEDSDPWNDGIGG